MLSISGRTLHQNYYLSSIVVARYSAPLFRGIAYKFGVDGDDGDNYVLHTTSDDRGAEALPSVRYRCVIQYRIESSGIASLFLTGATSASSAERSN